MTHDDLQDLLAPYALNAASPDERRAVEGHVPGCPDCRKTLRNFRAASLALPLSLPPARPSAGVKARVIAGLAPARRFAWGPLALAASVLLCAGVWLSARQNAWRVMEASGGVHADGRALRAGDRLRAGARLTLSSDARLAVRLAARAVFRLSPGSDATVTRAGGGFFVRLDRGGIFSVVKTGTPYRVQTPLASAAALGTVFYVNTEAPGRAYVCLCAGRLRVEAPGFSEEMAADHHKAVVLESDGEKTRAAPGALIGHADAEGAALAALLK